MAPFLFGSVYFSSDFYHIHLPFEAAFKSLDIDSSFPTWMPIFQNGKGFFGDMANSYSPYSIDFLLTYAISKITGLDQILGLVRLNTLRILLLTLVFAWGCRKFAGLFTKNSLGLELAFLSALFVGAFFLPHRPIFVMCSIYLPWALYFLTRLLQSSDDQPIKNLLGLGLSLHLGVFHQFNIQSTVVWPILIIYGFVFWMVEPSFSVLKLWRQHLSCRLAMIATVCISLFACLPRLWEFWYFTTFNRKMIYPGETDAVLMKEDVYTPVHFLAERFEWQKLLTFLFPQEKINPIISNLTEGIPGYFFHNFQYFGIIVAVLLLISLVQVRSKKALALVFSTLLYFSFGTITQAPFFQTAFHLHYPMTRHLLFFQLHAAPLILALGAVGAEQLSNSLAKQKSIIWKITFWIVLAALPFLILASNRGRDIHALFFIACAVVLLTFVIVHWLIRPIPIQAVFWSMLGLAAADLFAQNYNAQKYVLESGRANDAHIYGLAVTYDKTTPDLDFMDSYYLYAPLPPSAYVHWELPPFYFPALYKHAIIGNKSFFDLYLNSTPTEQAFLAGYLGPRIQFVQDAILDIDKQQARQAFRNTYGYGPKVFVHAPHPDAKASSLGQKPSKRDAEETEFTESVLAKNLNELPAELAPGQSYEVVYDCKSDKIFNFISSEEPELFANRAALLFASHDQVNWREIGYFTSSEYRELKRWRLLNEEAFQYYKIVVKPGARPFSAQQFSSIRFGYRGRKLNAKNALLDYPVSFALRNIEKGLAIYSADLPADMGLEYDSHPSQQFAFEFSVEVDGQSKPIDQSTWANDFFKPRLMQVNYLKDRKVTISLEKDPKLPSVMEGHLKLRPHPAPVLVKDFGPTKQTYESNSPTDGWLVLSDTWDPYWKAAIDGFPAEVLPANIQFKTVRVPAGRHSILVYHQPTAYLILIALNYLVFGAIALGFLIAAGKIRKGTLNAG